MQEHTYQATFLIKDTLCDEPISDLRASLASLLATSGIHSLLHMRHASLSGASSFAPSLHPCVFACTTSN